MSRRGRWIVLAGSSLAVVLLAVFFGTARYGLQAEVHFISRPPIATISRGRDIDS